MHTHSNSDSRKVLRRWFWIFDSHFPIYDTPQILTQILNTTAFNQANYDHKLHRYNFVELIPVACLATWGSAVSSVTSSGGIFSRPRRRREETWPSLPAWCCLCRCSPLPPASPTATGEEAYLKCQNLSDQTILVHPWPELQMPFYNLLKVAVTKSGRAFHDATWNFLDITQFQRPSSVIFLSSSTDQMCNIKVQVQESTQDWILSELVLLIISGTKLDMNRISANVSVV